MQELCISGMLNELARSTSILICLPAKHTARAECRRAILVARECMCHVSLDEARNDSRPSPIGPRSSDVSRHVSHSYGYD